MAFYGVLYRFARGADALWPLRPAMCMHNARTASALLAKHHQILPYKRQRRE
jgi:hypothetical protein